MAQPDQMLTVTGLLRPRERALAVMRKLRGWLTRRNIRGAWAYHLEVNPRKTGAHSHIWWRGDHMSRSLLSEAAVACGAGHDADARSAFAPYGSTAPELTYGFKAILENRLTPPTDLSPEARAYLELNGGKLVTASHGFWTDWDGNPIQGGAVPARAVANGWRGPRPHSDFLAEWRQEPIPRRP